MDWGSIIKELVAHTTWSLAVLAAFGGALYWWSKKVLPGTIRQVVAEETPTGVKLALSNGAGDLVRTIVKGENATQTVEHVSQVQAVIDAHEAREREQWGKLVERVEGIDRRLVVVEERLPPKRGRVKRAA